MKTYVMFDYGEIKFIPVDISALQEKGSIELEGVSYDLSEISTVFYPALVKGEQSQVLIMKRKG